MRSYNYSGLESISSRALHFSCDKLIPPNLINFLDLPVPLSMKTLSLYVYNKDTHRTMISASPDGDRIRTFFSLLLSDIQRHGL